MSDDVTRDTGREQARLLGLDPEDGAQLWVQAYMRGVIDGGTKVAKEICAREGHNLAEVTTRAELARGERRYLCRRCPASTTVTTTVEDGNNHQQEPKP